MKSLFTISQCTLFANLVFIASFVVMLFIYDYHKTFSEPPQSYHIWRQTNSLAIAQTYYQDELPFFKPEILNQIGDGGYSGKTAGEFPIMYYTVAQLWKVFGNEIAIFRIVQLIILFVGLFALYRSLQFVLKNTFWAGFISLLLFTSPMVVFYGPNFLPDVPALSFVLVAWYFIFRFLKNRSDINLWISAMFFGLAMLLKITSALSFIALGGWIIFETVFQNTEERVFNFRVKQILPFIIIIPLVAAWYIYVEFYNNLHNGHVSYHGIWPVWDLTKEQLDKIVFQLKAVYFKEFFLPYTQFVTFGIWIYLVVTIRKLRPVLQFFIILLPVGMLLQLLLWFQVLEGHDYYTINLLIFFVFVWGVFIHKIKEFKFFSHPVFYVLIIAFFIWNLLRCEYRIEKHYIGWRNEFYLERLQPLTEIQSLFDKLGIGVNQKVISIPDFTINSSLYFMQRKGYTDFGSDFTSSETFYSRIEQGAKFLVINDSTILKQPILKPFIKVKLGEYKNILIYDLQGIIKNE